jgi:hypothetical protein
MPWFVDAVGQERRQPGNPRAAGIEILCSYYIEIDM